MADTNGCGCTCDCIFNDDVSGGNAPIPEDVLAPNPDPDPNPKPVPLVEPNNPPPAFLGVWVKLRDCLGLSWLEDKPEAASVEDSNSGKLFLGWERLPFNPGAGEDEDIGMRGA